MQDEETLNYLQALFERELRAAAVHECQDGVAEQDSQVGQGAIFVKEGKNQSNDKKEHKAEGDGLAQRGDALMFLIYIYFPIAVLVILLEQLVETRPDNVVGLYIFAQENLIPGLGESEVVLIILIASEFLVEKSHFLKYFAFVGSEGDGIHITFFVARAEVGVAHAKRLRHSIADDERLLVGVAVGEDATAAANLVVGEEHLDIAFDKVFFNGAVGSEDDDHVAIAVGDAHVQRIGCSSLFVQNQVDIRIFFRIMLNDISGAVITHSIANKNRKLFLGKIRSSDGFEACSDVSHLVSTGDNYGDCFHIHQSSKELYNFNKISVWVFQLYFSRTALRPLSPI